MKLRLDYENADRIESALEASYDFAQIQEMARDAESALHKIGIRPSLRGHAQVEAISKTAKTGSKQATKIVLKRGKRDWFLTDISKARTSDGRTGDKTLRLNPNQFDATVKEFMRQNESEPTTLPG